MKIMINLHECPYRQYSSNVWTKSKAKRYVNQIKDKIDNNMHNSLKQNIDDPNIGKISITQGCS